MTFHTYRWLFQGCRQGLSDGGISLQMGADDLFYLVLIAKFSQRLIPGSYGVANCNPTFLGVGCLGTRKIHAHEHTRQIRLCNGSRSPNCISPSRAESPRTESKNYVADLHVVVLIHLLWVFGGRDVPSAKCPASPDPDGVRYFEVSPTPCRSAPLVSKSFAHKSLCLSIFMKIWRNRPSNSEVRIWTVKMLTVSAW